MRTDQSFCGDLADGLWRERPQAAARTLETYGTPLFSYLSLMLGDRDVATHALADTLIVAVGHAGRLAEPERLPAWLFALARRERERRQRAAAARAIPDTLGSPTALASRPAAEAEAASAAGLGYLALARLGIAEREAVLLGAMRPLLRAPDIARVLGTGHLDAADLRSQADHRFREETSVLGLRSDVAVDELVADMSRYLVGGMPRDRVIYMCMAPDMAERRRQVQGQAGPFGADGFPATARDPEPAATSRRPLLLPRLRLSWRWT